MTHLHSEINERLVLRTVDNLVGELRCELAAFLRHLGLTHLLEEVFVPLAATTRTRAAVAYEERPWPPAGIGARAVRGIATAVLSDNGQALLTPAMLSPEHATNVGLAGGLMKQLFEGLAQDGVEWVALFVNERSKVVAGELRHAGFEPRQARLLTDGAVFIAHAARPAAVLEYLGLGAARLGDALALNLEGSQLSRLTTFHLALAAGVANHWAGRTGAAEVFPGHVDWASLPPGGITGTGGPKVGVEPVVIVTP
jgi:hypothetical protein